MGGHGLTVFRGGFHRDVRGRGLRARDVRALGLFALAMTAALVLASAQRAVPPPANDSTLIGGPFARLLAQSADLGPDRSGQVQVIVGLRDSTRPDTLIGWANDRTLSVHWRPGDKWAIVEGAPETVASAFGVAVHNYRSIDGQVFYASAHQPGVPAAVRGEVTGLGRILSYGQLRRARPFTIPLDVPKPGLTPTQLLNTYDARPLATTGKDQTIVFFELGGGFSQSDLDKFADMFTPKLPRFTPLSKTKRPQNKPDDETTMDIEVAHAIAPEAQLVIFNALDYIRDPISGTQIANMFDTAAREYPGAVWSLSIELLCDRFFNSHNLQPAEDALSNAEAHGTSAFNSSGDTAGFECKAFSKDPNAWSDPPSPDDVGLGTMGSLPKMTDVGGTSVSTDANGVWVSEQAWFDVAMSQGTGGGVSTVWDRPGYQKKLSVSADSTHRLAPDVAADADPRTGVQIVFNGKVAAGGGTSQSAPIWAALAALMNQYLEANGGHPLGEINPTLYQIAASSAPPAFHDITLGGNGVHRAGPGFNLATGLGTPDVNNLVHDILDIQRGGGR